MLKVTYKDVRHKNFSWVPTEMGGSPILEGRGRGAPIVTLLLGPVLAVYIGLHIFKETALLNYQATVYLGHGSRYLSTH